MIYGPSEVTAILQVHTGGPPNLLTMWKALTNGVLRVVNIVINIFGDDHKTKHCPPHFGFIVGQPEIKPPKHMPLEISITNEQKIKVTLAPVTATSKPAKLDGAPTWEVVTGNSTVVVADDGLSADLVSADDPGDTQFLVKADADLGAGITEISDIIKLTVLGAQAASLGLTAGTPEAKA